MLLLYKCINPKVEYFTIVRYTAVFAKSKAVKC